MCDLPWSGSVGPKRRVRQATLCGKLNFATGKYRLVLSCGHEVYRGWSLPGRPRWARCPLCK
jgi:hypothetical protein